MESKVKELHENKSSSEFEDLQLRDISNSYVQAKNSSRVFYCLFSPNKAEIAQNWLISEEAAEFRARRLTLKNRSKAELI